MSDTHHHSIHRQELRDASDHTTVTLPYTDGELARAAGDLEEIVLALVHDDPDAETWVPPALATPDAAQAVGRLASYIGAWERAEPAVQPVAPDGRYELVPLQFMAIGRNDRGRITDAVAHLTDAGVEDVISDYAGSRQAGEQLVAAAQRLVALLQLPWDDDVDLLHARLGRGATARPTERVVLTEDEYGAYRRVTERILASWHANDPLERFVYRGA
jgi:hypothetical protein